MCGSGINCMMIYVSQHYRCVISIMILMVTCKVHAVLLDVLSCLLPSAHIEVCITLYFNFQRLSGCNLTGVMHFYEPAMVYISHFISSFPVECFWKDVFFQGSISFQRKSAG